MGAAIFLDVDRKEGGCGGFFLEKNRGCRSIQILDKSFRGVYEIYFEHIFFRSAIGRHISAYCKSLYFREALISANSVFYFSDYLSSPITLTWVNPILAAVFNFCERPSNREHRENKMLA